MKSRLVALMTIALGTATAVAAPLAPLEKTALFSKTVAGCHPVDLRAWMHPTRTVLQDNQVVLEKVMLCNRDLYPVFFVRFRHALQDGTENYFLPIYEEMRIANAGHPLAFVSLSDHTVVSVSFGGQRSIETSLEVYAPDPASH